jgi:hypothetical protein
VDVRERLRFGTSRAKQPVSLAELETVGLVGQGWEYFSATERSIAEWLRSNAVQVRSVSVSRISGRRTPDGALAAGETVEFKTLVAGNGRAILRNLRDAREQSRRVVLDGRDVALPGTELVSGLAGALRRYGGDFDEIVFVRGTGAALHWP